MAARAGMATDANGIPQPVQPSQTTGSPVFPASLHHPAPRSRCSLCIPASPFSYFLGRMLWGSGALGDSGAPPHTPCAFLLSPAALVKVGLQGAGSVCSLNPCYHWAASGFIIRCHAIRLQLVALVDAIEADALPPKSVISRQTFTNCEDVAPTTPTHHRWRRSHDMLSATAAMQPSPDTIPAAGGRQGTGTPFPITRQIPMNINACPFVDTFRSRPAPAGMTHDSTAGTWCVWIACPNAAGTGWDEWLPLTRWDYQGAAAAHLAAKENRLQWPGHLLAVRRGNAGQPLPTVNNA